MKKTKKVVQFVVEFFELEYYWHSENGVKYEIDYYTGQYSRVKSTRYWLTPSCYKRTYYKKFNSVSKLNKALGLEKGKFYFFYTSLEEAIKGAYATDFYSIKNRNEKVLIVRQLHDLDSRYIFSSH